MLNRTQEEACEDNMQPSTSQRLEHSLAAIGQLDLEKYSGKTAVF